MHNGVGHRLHRGQSDLSSQRSCGRLHKLSFNRDVEEATDQQPFSMVGSMSQGLNLVNLVARGGSSAAAPTSIFINGVSKATNPVFDWLLVVALSFEGAKCTIEKGAWSSNKPRLSKGAEVCINPRTNLMLKTCSVLVMLPWEFGLHGCEILGSLLMRFMDVTLATRDHGLTFAEVDETCVDLARRHLKSCNFTPLLRVCDGTHNEYVQAKLASPAAPPVASKKPRARGPCSLGRGDCKRFSKK
eukprot:1682780-Amphidinium_carterae.1